jgi:pimeloyl-ACP methyl ester carboxylesterase
MFSRRSKIFLRGIAFVFSCFLFQSCLTFRAKPKSIEHFFETKKVKGTVNHYVAGNRTMQYAEAGDSLKPIVLFVHGSPGSLSAFTNYLVDTVLLHKAFLISADRPGFGYSGFGVGEPSLEKQAWILKQLLDLKENGQSVILVGHSLGGPLVVKLAMDFPDLVDGLVIVAGSIDPELEPNDSWWRGPLASPLLSFILPRSLRASNEELYHLKPELEKMLPYWKNITCPVVVIHGKKDPLVAFENVQFAKTKLINTSVDFILHESANHFIPWQNPELVNDGILLMLKKAGVFRSERHAVVD